MFATPRTTANGMAAPRRQVQPRMPRGARRDIRSLGDLCASPSSVVRANVVAICEVPAAPRELCYEPASYASAADMGAGRAPSLGPPPSKPWRACPPTMPSSSGAVVRAAGPRKHHGPGPDSPRATGTCSGRGSPMPTARATIVWPATSRRRSPPKGRPSPKVRVGGPRR